MNLTDLAEDRFVLAFYGAEPPADALERFFYLAVAWFTELGYPPDRLGVGGAGYSKKMGTFRRGVKKVEALGFSTVEDFSMSLLIPNDISGSLHFVSAVFSRSRRSGRYAVLSVPSSTASKDVWVPVAREVIDTLRPLYGIGFERSLREGPDWYAIGVNVWMRGDKIAVGDEYDQRRSIARWGDVGMEKEVYREGLLRYVYRWNFLTQPQLAREVEGTTLARWIEGDQERGTLGPFSNDVWLWEVEASQLERVRNQLHDAGAIFDWRRYCNVEPHIRTKLG